jgi:hypothetical protein
MLGVFGELRRAMARYRDPWTRLRSSGSCTYRRRDSPRRHNEAHERSVQNPLSPHGTIDHRHVARLVGGMQPATFGSNCGLACPPQLLIRFAVQLEDGLSQGLISATFGQLAFLYPRLSLAHIVVSVWLCILSVSVAQFVLARA